MLVACRDYKTKANAAFGVITLIHRLGGTKGRVALCLCCCLVKFSFVSAAEVMAYLVALKAEFLKRAKEVLSEAGWPLLRKGFTGTAPP